MPGSVANAVAATVLPQSLFRSFSHAREFPLIENEYKNGESQRSLLASTSRKRWQLSERLTPSQLATLRSFYDARNGPQEAFYFYDPYEKVPKFSYDPTGVATSGRYAVRFDSPWQQSGGPARVEVQLTLVQVA